MKRNGFLSNEGGFALLLSIVILFLLASVLLHTLTIYEREKGFMAMEKEWNSFDQLLMNSVMYVLGEMNEAVDDEMDELFEGTLDFFEGYVHYQISYEDEECYVLLRAHLRNGKEKGAKFIYMKDTKKIHNWVEGVHVR